jgi:hypothetical protein
MSFKPGNATGVEASIAARIRECEGALLDSAIRRQPALILALLAEDFVEFGASGRRWNRQQIVDLLAVEEFSPPSMENFACRLIADGVALATYKAVRTDPLTGSRSVSLRSSIWTKESAGWLLRFHQGTPTV